jgi:hypothetical protein
MSHLFFVIPNLLHIRVSFFLSHSLSHSLTTHTHAHLFLVFASLLHIHPLLLRLGVVVALLLLVLLRRSTAAVGRISKLLVHEALSYQCMRPDATSE